MSRLPYGAITMVAKKHKVSYSRLRLCAVANTSIPLDELARTIKNGDTPFGIGCQKQVANILTRRGLHVQEQPYNAPFDLLVGGWRIEVKAARLRKVKNGQFLWTFNIHRHGDLDENCDAYIFRLEGVPHQSNAIYMFFRAPLRVKVFSISMRSLLNSERTGIMDFHRFVRGEFKTEA